MFSVEHVCGRWLCSISSSPSTGHLQLETKIDHNMSYLTMSAINSCRFVIHMGFLTECPVFCVL